MRPDCKIIEISSEVLDILRLQDLCVSIEDMQTQRMST